MRSLGRMVLVWLQVVGAVLVLTGVLWLAAAAIWNLQLLSVQSGSMRPAFGPGDALIARRADITQVHVGQIVAYHSSLNKNELVTHRLVKTGADGTFQAKGDALTVLDPPVNRRALDGRVIATLSGLGTALDWLRTWPGLATCVYLPAAAIAAGELKRLAGYRRRHRPYYLSAHQVI